MELDYLRYVIKLSKCLHFSKAAAELNITQPSLSQRISQIENKLGVKLFERKTRSVTLTAAGEEFLLHAEKVLAAYEQLQEAMRKQSLTRKGTLHIGTLLNMARLDINAQILAFQKEHPHIQLTINEIVGSFELIHQLEADTFDVVFFTPSPDIKLTEKIKVCPILTGQVVAAIPENHRLATRPVISLHELKEENLLFPAKVHSLFGILMTACRGSGFEPKIVAQASQVDTAIEMASQNVGIALLSSQFIGARQGIAIVPVEPAIARNITLAYSSRTANFSAIKVFRDFILRQSENYISKSIDNRMLIY